MRRFEGPGSLGHYGQDMKTMAGFGMDFIKVDYCPYDQGNPARFIPPIHDQLAYVPMTMTTARAAVAAAARGRPVLFASP